MCMTRERHLTVKFNEMQKKRNESSADVCTLIIMLSMNNDHIHNRYFNLHAFRYMHNLSKWRLAKDVGFSNRYNFVLTHSFLYFKLSSIFLKIHVQEICNGVKVSPTNFPVEIELLDLCCSCRI